MYAKVSITIQCCCLNCNVISLSSCSEVRNKRMNEGKKSPSNL